MDNKKRYDLILTYFQEHVPNPAPELVYANAFQLVVAVVLSAQCTDKRVNMVTSVLFSKYPTPQALADAAVEEIYDIIKSVSYPNNKAGHLSALAKTIVTQFHGTVPDNMEDLMQLQGVGRKTANVILSVIYNKPTMAVDTHVFRVAHRIGLVTDAGTPLSVEKQLVENIPQSLIPKAHHWLILHGRYVCTARNPKCNNCGIEPYCEKNINL